MSNYPLGAANDPRAPYNAGPEEDFAQDVIEIAFVEALNEADALVLDQLMEIVRESVKDAIHSNVPGEWADVMMDSRDSLEDEVYDRVRERFNRIFKQD